MPPVLPLAGDVRFSVPAAEPAAGGASAHPMVPGLIWAFRIGPDGVAQARPDGVLPLEPHDGWTWLHLDLTDTRALHWIGGTELPPPAKALLQAADAYQQIHNVGGCVYGAIADLGRDIDEITEDIGLLRFAMTEHLVITGRHQPLGAVDEARRALETGHRVESCAGLFDMIVHNVAEAIEAIADDMAQALDRLEEKLLTDDTDELRQGLGRLRRSCVRLHRHLSGLRVLLHRFDRDGAELAPRLRPCAGKLAQRLDGLDHSVVEMRERSRLLQEELHLQIEEQGNSSLRVLSVLTALLLPPTLVTGMFGMNLHGLPFAEDAGGFVWAIVIMLLSSIVAYVVMKRFGLIR
ncbi:cobalt transporter [Rhodopseudomonas palustris]|uniref:transporter n=1 Tax=Rhodopseudomonas palustris TaxID=1076 RepID=UPI00115E82B2|nr:transporter [Rhodopseudomonas palustris]QDL98369.1 cobalt transporter [Rhodopseudomonas palustris]